MKKLKSTLFTLCTCLALFAQAPQSINYQAIAWNANNTPRTNQTITATFNIRSTTAEGTIEFTEVHTTNTNEQGLFTLTIGSVRQNDFKNIDWSKSPKFLQVIVDGLPAGTTQILSVPYALYAERTKLIAGQGIGINGNTISNTGDRDTTNEIQRLSLNGSQLSLSKNGGTVVLPSSGGSGTTYSAGTGISISPTNVISTDLKAGDGIFIVGNTISGSLGSTAAGDLNGTYPDPTVDGIQRTPVSAAVPQQGQVLMFDNGQWKPQTLSNSTSLTQSFLLQSQEISIQSTMRTRGNFWADVKLSNEIAITQLPVSETGIYLILANLKVTSVQPSDEEFQLQVLRVNDNDALIQESTVFQKSNSQVQIEKGELTTWTIIQLTEDQLIKLQYRMIGDANNSAYSYTHAKLALIKLQ